MTGNSASSHKQWWAPVFKTLLTLILACSCSLAQAHDARPVFIHITETTVTDSFDIKWKVPASAPEYTHPSPVMPRGCQMISPLTRGETGDAYTYSLRFRCDGPLTGDTIGVTFPANNPGLSTLIKIDLQSGASYTHILPPGELEWQIPQSENTLSVIKQYTLLGTEHIFAGIDHLLFVACLVFIAGTPKRILITITGFTLAHSVTLALSSLNVITVPTPPVEAAIALSIVFLAHEIVVNDRKTWTWRFPIAVSTSFGFLHGFGFASALRGIGLPQLDIPVALLFFNVGVEIGQILFILALLTALLLVSYCLNVSKNTLLNHHLTTTLGGYAIGITSSLWLIERIAGFF